jgi:hypothetical protein
MREVVHIDTATGSMGGEVWKLTLDCGHQAYRPKRELSPQNIFEPLSRKLAPHRARCLFCPAEAKP